MQTTVKTRLVRIGNPQGFYIPKPIIEQHGFSEKVLAKLVEMFTE